MTYLSNEHLNSIALALKLLPLRTAAMGGFFIFALILFLRPRAARCSNCIYLIVLLALLFCARAYWLFLDWSPDYDEAVYRARAMAMQSDPVFWRSTNGTSSGPLHQYALSFLIWLGLDNSFSTQHILGSVIVALNLVLFYLACSLVFDERTAQLATLFPAIFWGCAYHAHFLHYFSEGIPVLLTQAGVLGVAYILKKERLKVVVGALASFALGMTPWAKLQAVPLSLFVAAILVIVFLKRWRDLAGGLWISCAGILPTVIGIILLNRENLLADAYFVYVESNIVLATSVLEKFVPSLSIRLQQALALYTEHPLFVFYGLGILALFALSFIRPTVQIDWRIRICALAGILTCLFINWQSGKFYLHYLNYSVQPLAWLAALGLVGNDLLIKTSDNWLRRSFYFARRQAGLVALSPLVALAYCSDPPAPTIYELSKPRVHDLIIQHSKTPTVALWDWTPIGYTLSGLAPATREVHPDFTAYYGVPEELRDIYARRYLHDLDKSRPSIIMQATYGKDLPYILCREFGSPMAYPVLVRYITSYYSVLEIGASYKLYLRN